MINELTRKNAHTELDHIFKTILPAHGMTERPEQIRLSHTMLDAMFENRIALSDAGTGIGKTYAYLTAAIVYSHSRLVDGLPFQAVWTQTLSRSRSASSVPRETSTTAVHSIWYSSK